MLRAVGMTAEPPEILGQLQDRGLDPRDDALRPAELGGGGRLLDRREGGRDDVGDMDVVASLLGVAEGRGDPLRPYG